MVMNSSRSTCTVRDDGQIVPWLAASGDLAYTPENPPSSDYYFQYSWILPGIFDPATNRRRHFYFGAHYKDDAKELLSFWNEAGEGRAVSVACRFGSVGVDARITAPVAIYSALDLRDRPCYLFMQHGSYQIIPIGDQPLLSRGEVLLYRGIGRSRVFRFVRVDRNRFDADGYRLWQIYVRAHSGSRIPFCHSIPFTTERDAARRVTSETEVGSATRLQGMKDSIRGATLAQGICGAPPIRASRWLDGWEN